MANTRSKLQQAYSEFFKAMLDEFGVKSPGALGDRKSEFFKKIKKDWKVAKKKIKEGVLRQTIRDVITEVISEGKIKTTFGKLEVGDDVYFESGKGADLWVKWSNRTAVKDGDNKEHIVSTGQEVFIEK